jgi:hypothetical protein
MIVKLLDREGKAVDAAKNRRPQPPKACSKFFGAKSVVAKA